MAGVRVELWLLVLLVLNGTLLLVPVQGQKWEPVHEDQINYYEQWAQPHGIAYTDDDSDSDTEEVPEEEFPPLSETDEPYADPDIQVESEEEEDEDEEENPPNSVTSAGYMVEYEESPPREGPEEEYEESLPSEEHEVEYIKPSSFWDSDTDTDADFGMEYVAPPRSWTSSTSPGSSGLDVVCSELGFQITLQTGSLSDVKVLGSKVVSVTEAPEYCGYEVNSFENSFTVPFSGCNVEHTDRYSLELLYVEDSGETRLATASCEQSIQSQIDLFPRTQRKPKSKCNNPPSKATNCAVTSAERVPCGHSGISSSDCQHKGCCMESNTCYYPLDECTGDKHFVFAIRPNSASGSTSLPVDPTKLGILGHPNCKPVIVNDQVAIFKFKVTECGTRAYTVGETKIYLAEVQSVVKALNLKYGIITRSEPLRFRVECRYGKSGDGPKTSLASVGVMVKTPSSSLPSSVVNNGLYGVQLRIAKDQTYSSYHPTFHQPLRLLLGKPVYLEVRLKSPKPDAVVLVNYCLAYPRSATNALVLIYEGCANPHDPNVSILKISGNTKNRHQRRFMVKAFQFMDQKTNKYLNEEIYFMCSTEVCRPTEKSCAQRCFDGKNL